MKHQRMELYKLDINHDSGNMTLTYFTIRSTWVDGIYTRVVPKVPLHSLFCHNNSTSDLTTIMVIKYYILGLFG